MIGFGLISLSLFTSERLSPIIERARTEDAAASVLTEAVLAFAKENGFEQLNLEVRSDNARAIRLYEKYGFQRAGLRPGYYQHPKEDAVIMTRYFNEQEGEQP